MKQTPFRDLHIKLGAKMHEFAGYDMPIEYSGIIDEHLAVVNGVGMFDVSHMGEFWVRGEKALQFLQKMTCNDLSILKPGKAQYSCLINENGGIVDDLIIYRFEGDNYLMVVNAANIEKDWAWCQKWNSVGAELENASDRMALLALQGPKALDTLQKLTDEPLSAIPYYHFVTGSLAGVKEVIISNTGYTGAGGFELYFSPDDGIKIWDAIMEAGDEYGIKPIGLGARDTLRLEMGYSLYGNELDDGTTPLQAGLGWITKFVDDKPFVGRDRLERERAEGVPRKLVCFTMMERGVPRNGYEILSSENELIGNVTSGSIAPTLNRGIGMGYLKPQFSKIGSEIFIKVRNRILRAEVVKPPFRKQN